MKSLYRFWVKPLDFSTKFNYELCGISIQWIENNTFEKIGHSYILHREKNQEKYLFEF